MLLVGSHVVFSNIGGYVVSISHRKVTCKGGIKDLLITFYIMFRLCEIILKVD